MTTCRKIVESLALIVLILQVTSLSANAQTAFDRVDALSASKAQHKSAQFFRSVFVSDTVGPYGSQRLPGGTVVSLNPKDSNALPCIWDTVTDQFIPLQAPAQAIDGVQILRVLEVGAFNGKYAAASASIRENAGTRVAWGYVDRMGKWAVAPRYDYAYTPINRWGQVGARPGHAGFTQTLDIGTGKPLSFPDGYSEKRDGGQALGAHAYFWVEKYGEQTNFTQKIFFIDAGTGKMSLLPSAPRYSSNTYKPVGKAIPLDGGDLGFFDVTTGKIAHLPYFGNGPIDLAGDAFAFWNSQGAGMSYSVWNYSEQKLVASDLRNAQAFAEKYFVACDRSNSESPVVRIGPYADPRPIARSTSLRCGLMDANGKWRIAARDFQQFHLLNDSLAVFRSAKEWCSLDLRTDNPPTCNATIPDAMLSAGLMLDVSWKSLAETQDKPGIYGYRDALGDLRIPLQFERATPFAGKIAAVRQFDVPGLINSSGTWLTPMPPTHIDMLTQQRDSVSSNRRHDGRLCKDCFGVIDRAGNWVLTPTFSDGAPGPKQSLFWLRGLGDAPYLLAGVDGVPKAYGGNRSLEKLQPLVSHGATADIDAIVATSINGKWGLADRDEKWVLKPQFDDLQVVSATRAIVQSKGKWGMVSVSGEWVIPAAHSNLNILNDWFVAACTKDGESCTTFTAEGKKTVQVLQVSSIAPFDAKGYASAQDKVTALWGYLNRQGSWAIEPKYLKAFSFNGEYALVQQQQVDGDVTANTPQPKSPDDFFTTYVALWPASRLAVVTSTPSSWVAQTRQSGQRWYSENQQFPTVVSLIDTEGRLLVPKTSFWKAAR